MVEIVFEKDIPKNAVILAGFQSIGLVGALAAQYTAEQSNAEVIGYIDVPEFPPIAILVNGQIRHPIRIHKFKHGSKNFIVFESELPIPQKMVNVIAKQISRFARKFKVKEIVSLEGLAVQKTPSTSNIYWISNIEKKFENFNKHANSLKSGIVVGVSAALLMQAKVEKIPAAVLMAEAHSDFPDGLAAANLIKTLNKIYNFKIDTSPLEKESKKFEEKIWAIVEKAHQLKEVGEKPVKTYIG